MGGVEDHEGASSRPMYDGKRRTGLPLRAPRNYTPLFALPQRCVDLRCIHQVPMRSVTAVLSEYSAGAQNNNEPAINRQPKRDRRAPVTSGLVSLTVLPCLTICLSH